jgi:hypothetical protein
MDPWKEYAAWESGRDKQRQWAALEGKSSAMSDDLYRSQSASESAGRKPLGFLNACAHAGIWLVELWRYFRSG